MTPRILAATAAALALAPAAASAEPSTVFTGDAWRASAVAGPGGGAFTPWDPDTVALAARDGRTFAKATTAFTPVEFEKVWAAGLDAAGEGVVLTLRKHKPYQRVRASLRSKDGAVTPATTISAKGHSASSPSLAVARDGSAIAAWAWHDPAGWVVQAATRPAGGRFGAPQTLSQPTKWRPFVTLAIGEGGEGVAGWQLGGDYRDPEEPLSYATAHVGQPFGAAAKLGDGGGHADLALAVAPDGAMLAAWTPTYYLGKGDSEPAKLVVADRAPGQPFGAPRTLTTGGPGFVDQGGPDAAFTSDGGALVAWVRPTSAGHTKGVVEAFARPPGGDFDAGQQLSDPSRSPAGVELAAGRHGEAALVWWDAVYRNGVKPDLRVRASTRAAHDTWRAPVQVSPDGQIALWPDVAVDDAGEVLAGWIANDSGGGSGDVQATVLK